MRAVIFSLLVTLGHARFRIPALKFVESMDAPSGEVQIMKEGSAIFDDGDIDSYIIVPDDNFNILSVATYDANGKKTLTGYVYPLKSFDHEKQAKYQVEIFSKLGDVIIDRQNVTIQIVDKNDNNPKFVPESLVIKVTEDVQPGDTLGKIEATDKDSDEITNLMYSFLPSFGKYSVQFTHRVDGQTSSQQWTEDDMVFEMNAYGFIKLKNNLSPQQMKFFDAEKYKKIVIQGVQVIDDIESGVFGQDTAELTIHVGDVNDHAPVFDPNGIFEFNIRENSEVGVPIEHIKIENTSDEDISDDNSKIAYLLEGDDADYFRFDSNNVLQILKPLDYETKNLYKLELVAFNPRGIPADLASRTQFIIHVTDENEPPVFISYEAPPYELVEEDDSLVNKQGGVVRFTDGDSGRSSLSYTIEDPAGFFTINGQTGALTVAKIIDREWNCNGPGASDHHVVTVTATDMCSSEQLATNPDCQSLSTTHNVPIPIVNKDDHKTTLNSTGITWMCRENFELAVPIYDCDGDKVTVVSLNEDVTVYQKMDDLFYITIKHPYNVQVGEKIVIPLEATSSFNGTLTTVTHQLALDVCPCIEDDEGNIKPSCAAIAGAGTMQPWIIVLLILLICTIIAIALFVVIQRRRKTDDDNHEADDLLPKDHSGGIGQDDLGCPAGDGQFDDQMTLPYLVSESKQGRRRHSWVQDRPDGNLADIINQFKNSADQDDVVPNGLLTFEFEGRNSMISDLSSLNSYGSETSLAIDNLPDSIKKQFR